MSDHYTKDDLDDLVGDDDDINALFERINEKLESFSSYVINDYVNISVAEKIPIYYLMIL